MIWESVKGGSQNRTVEKWDCPLYADQGRILPRTVGILRTVPAILGDSP